MFFDISRESGLSLSFANSFSGNFRNLMGRGKKALVREGWFHTVIKVYSSDPLLLSFIAGAFFFPEKQSSFGCNMLEFALRPSLQEDVIFSRGSGWVRWSLWLCLVRSHAQKQLSSGVLERAELGLVTGGGPQSPKMLPLKGGTERDFERQ